MTESAPIREPEPALAFLRNGGALKSVCIGCSQILAGLGMLRVVGSRPLPIAGLDGTDLTTFCIVLYEIEPPYTLANCQSLVRERHVGGKWGE